MKFERAFPKAPKDVGDYRFAWAVSFALAIVSAPAIILYKQSAPWLIAVPLSLGTIFIVIYEFRTAFSSQSVSEVLVTFPPSFVGQSAYSRLLSLEIQPKTKVPKEQLPLFPGFTDTTAAKSLRLIRDEKGQEIAVVSCDRFSALLVTYLLDNMDKATEKSLRAGLARFGELGKSHSDINIFVYDKTIREVIKSDFRGNLVTLVSKGGEKVIKDLLKSLELRHIEENEKTASDEKAFP